MTPLLRAVTPSPSEKFLLWLGRYGAAEELTAGASDYPLVHVSAVPAGTAEVLTTAAVAAAGRSWRRKGGGDESLLLGLLPSRRDDFCRSLREQSGQETMVSAFERLFANLTKPPQRLCGGGWQLGLDRPVIMGILNLTPDSFFDGGRYDERDQALARAEALVAEGADLIDVGGESSRPGAAPVGVEDELKRVVPVVETLARRLPIPISVDTTKARVAEAGLEAGAAFINDISGLTFDPDLAAVVARYRAGLFLMHTSGRPEVMQQQTDYEDILGDICAALQQSLAMAAQAGIAPERLAVDPGIGFGKNLEGNLEILQRLGELRSLGAPILLGTSRKSFIGKVLNQEDPADRLPGTLATIPLGLAAGAMLHRVHDVAPARQAADLAWAIISGGAGPRD